MPAATSGWKSGSDAFELRRIPRYRSRPGQPREAVETTLPHEQAASHVAQNGDSCTVTGGVHAGKSGVVEDRNVSKTGHVTITVRQADGGRFKTLARNIVIHP